jgi:fatty-acid desaturase
MVNMPILILHTTTFVLYLVAALFNYITLTIYYFNSQNDEAFRAYLWAVFFY